MGGVIEYLLIDICNVGIVVRLAPAQVLIVPLVRERPAKKRGS